MTSEAAGRTDPAAVLFLIHDLCLGGAERVFVHYVNRLDSPRPVPVLVRPRGSLARVLRPDLPLLTLSRGGPVGQEAANRARAPLLDVVSDTVPGGAALALPVKALRLRALLRSHEARCVSTFLHKSHLIALFTRDVLAPDLRVVVNVHEIPSQHLLHHFRGPARRVMERAYRWVFSRADALFVPAEGVGDDLVANFDAPAGRIRVLYNPLDLDEIRRKAREPLDGDGWGRHGARGCRASAGPGGGASRGADLRPFVAAVGRLVPLKGFDVLLRALPRMRTGAGLVLVGDGPERGGLEGLARRLGVEGRVRFTGEQGNPWRYVARADALAVPSRSEAFPNVIGEAMALGVPVVAADASAGVREYLDGGRCGLLVPDGDPQALATALDRVLTDTPLRAELAERGRSRVSAFDIGRAVDAYRRALVEVMEP